MIKKQKSFFQILFYSSFFSLILMVILLLVFISFFKTFRQEKKVRNQILALETEIKKIEGEKIRLFETLEYLKSDFYKEKEAREKFGMQRLGERVVVILPSPGNQKENNLEKNEKEENLPIFKKWWRYIFFDRKN